MRRRSCALLPMFGLALMALVCAGGHPGTVQAANLSQAQAEAPEDDTPPPADERPDPADSEIPGPDVPPRMGDTRRIDPFDDLEQQARAPHPAAAAHPDHDVVVCEAGCDGAAGTVVYMKSRE